MDQRTVTLTQAEFVDATNRAHVSGILNAANGAREAASVLSDLHAAAALHAFSFTLEEIAAEVSRKLGL